MDAGRPRAPRRSMYILRIAEMTHTELDSNVSGMWRNHNHAEMSQFSSNLFLAGHFVCLPIDSLGYPPHASWFRLWVDLTTTATTGFNPRVFLAHACRWQDSPRTAQSWEMQRPQVTETYWHMQLMLLRCYLFSSHRWQPESPPTLSAPGACSCRGSTRCGAFCASLCQSMAILVLATLGYLWQLVLKRSFLSLLLISCHLIFALALWNGRKLVVGVGLDFIQCLSPLVVISWCFWRMLFRLRHWKVL